MNPFWMFGLGSACLLAAALLYVKSTDRFIFPAILAIIGVFLVAAQSVVARLPGGIDLEFKRTVADTAQANVDAVSTQQQAIETLSKQIVALTKQFSDYQADVNQRFSQLNTTPVPVPATPPGLAVAPGALSAILRKSEIKRVEALDANRALQQQVPIG